MIDKIKNSNFVIKWTHWEYWPTWLAYLPVLPIVLYYVAKSRRWFFFSNVNPHFKTGALMGASKFKILEQIPDKFKPITLFVDKHERSIEKVKAQINDAGLTYPMIAKPDVGERGLLVAVINNEAELNAYLNANKIDILIQEYIDFPNECGIFYIRKPSEELGTVVSIGLKHFVMLEGDGNSTIRELMAKLPRTKLQIKRFEAEGAINVLNRVLNLGELYLLEPIGNHSRGTCFLDGNHLISEELHSLFNSINKEMDEVYYGRFDIKYGSWESLLRGENIKILEMNGIASEPIHVYDQNVSIIDKYRSFYRLWKTIYEISDIQKSRGVHPISLKTAYKAFREYKDYVNSINANWKNEIDKSFSLS